MNRYGKRCVLYPRVSTEMQVDGYSSAAPIGISVCIVPNFLNVQRILTDQ